MHHVRHNENGQPNLKVQWAKKPYTSLPNQTVKPTKLKPNLDQQKHPPTQATHSPNQC